MDILDKPDRTEPSVFLAVDVSVLAHQLAHRVSKYEQTGWTPEQTTTYLKACAHYLTSSWLLQPDGQPVRWAGILGLCDKKDRDGRYWRHLWLESERKFKGYKAGRSTPVASYLASCKQHLGQTLAKIGHTVSMPGYEADDWAGYLARTLPKNSQLVLLTVDTDWLGLVDPGRIAWVCAQGHKPPVRDTMTSVNEWASARLGTRFSQPSEIWVHKAEHGDASDNLSAKLNALDVIHLTEPAADYDLLTIVGSDYGSEVFSSAKANLKKAQPQKASGFCRSTGAWVPVNTKQLNIYLGQT